MSQVKLNLTANGEDTDTSWKSLYKIGGIAALAAIPLFLVDIIISFGGGDINPAVLLATDWFKLFRDNWLVGLRLLGIINVVSLTVTIPLYFAIYAVHSKICKAYASLALILYLVGAAVYISNNAAVPMFVLSSKYLAAATEVQRTLLAAAGEAIIARGADFTPGSFIGFFFTEIAGIAFSFIMLRGRIFSKSASYLGIVGFTLLSAFTVLLTFTPFLFNVAMLIAMAGGLLCMAWYILVGRELLKLGGM